MDRFDEIIRAFVGARERTEALAASLGPEDQLLQSMPACSPTKWHLAHTTWFFETFVLGPAGVAPFDPRFGYLFNSYYDAIGARHPRALRGMLSRPSVDEIGRYRAQVSDAVVRLLRAAPAERLDEVASVVRLGIAHEEQHQELLLTDILHAFSQNPLRPAYRAIAPTDTLPSGESPPLRFVPFDGGLIQMGAPESERFAFDNERPRHRRWVEPFELADRLVTVADVRAFATDGGYDEPSLWLSDGWELVRAHRVRAPLHAVLEPGACVVFGLDGERQARDDEPATHLSLYEADAIARWLGARLPTEAEWELAASSAPAVGNFLDSGWLRARPAAPPAGTVRQLFGDAWEWTRSAYDAYPGYAAPPGALGEYNAKFMVGQFVLRGGSCFTPPGHVRASYRNFWPPETRFQVTGVRLARSS